MSATNPVGIKAYSVFLPRLRMARSAIAQAHAWAFPSMRSKGQKALCTWDEDARALAVEASRDCQNDERSGIESLTQASTTAPFTDLQNASTAASAYSAVPSAPTVPAASVPAWSLCSKNSEASQRLPRRVLK
ncbi:hypothetical protein [Pseudomonas borbori]|uniref:Uncharacterized protein n=1 Tax=Pseudomonas borbori TaxID=289003 RepID=A0A1I5XHY9_9PSED|nr:hypothetical protein [Pseudomonas borbori]SFQ31277.1 hypothetical protein SAMN05216190_16011 [Pseudomonas borbori]